MCCAGRALRGRGAADEGLLARPERPSRCTLPITALRVTLPSSAAIWLAESPASHSFFSCSTRSSVQVNTVIAHYPFGCAGHLRAAALRANIQNPCRQNPLALAGRCFARPGVYAELRTEEGSDRRTRCRSRHR